MAAYYLLVGIPIIIYLIMRARNVRLPNLNKEQTAVSLFFILYLLLLCLRDFSVGCDTYSYVEKFFEPFKYYSWHQITLMSKPEWGFAYLTKIMTLISKNPHLYIAVVAIISIIPIWKLYKEESINGVLCISIFLITAIFDIFFSGIRQGLAIGVGVFSFYFVKEKKITPFLLMVVLAYICHRSAIVLILLYPVYHARITKKWLWVALPAMILLYIFKAQVFEFLFENFGGYYFEKYGRAANGYVPTEQYGQLILYFLFSFYTFVILDENEGGEEDVGLRNVLLLATAFQSFAPLHVIASRMNYYFMIFIPVAVSRSNTHCKVEYRKIASLASFVMEAFFIFYFFTRKGDSLEIFNYRLFF